ncbi:PP2C family protein-serine/threonine phosphatase [Streptomyces sp. NPDC052023]|uniref:PP2C family protein-serine/threonine phosphatase n=1 Tax=Streptomyces sp. NPDC052023 TaxID=3365681 RepID=UPI0037CFEB86
MPASAALGRLRAAIQTLADLELEPDELLTRIADLVQRLAAEAPPGDHDSLGATCLYAVHDPVTRRCVMASAGHPPPVLVRPDGTAEAVGISPGPPLAVSGRPYETTAIVLEPGSVLALYTDGLVEQCDRGLLIGLHPRPPVAWALSAQGGRTFCVPGTQSRCRGRGLTARCGRQEPATRPGRPGVTVVLL